MLMVSSTVGSATWIGWKRRSRAASFSMCFRYSSSVVAPMQCSSPRASIGLSMLEASIAPSAAPAPTTVCSSSMNWTIWPADSVTSLRTALRRSSNSPRYFAPATSAPRSRATMRLSLRPSGTSPRTMRWARPSTMAVLPTPGSPISTGLFLVRRSSTWMVRGLEHARKTRRCVGLLLGLAAGERPDERVEPLAHACGRHTQLVQQRGHDTTALFDQGTEQVLRLELRVVALLCLALRGGDRLLRFFGQPVQIHHSCPLSPLGRGGAQTPHLRLQFIDALFELADAIGEPHDHFDARQGHPHVVRQPADPPHALEVVQRVEPNAAF